MGYPFNMGGVPDLTDPNYQQLGGATLSNDELNDLLKRLPPQAQAQAGQPAASQPPSPAAAGSLPPPNQPGGRYADPNGQSLQAGPGEHLMRILNGPNVQDTRFAPVQGGTGMAATQTYNPNTGTGFQIDPSSGKWYQTGATPGAPPQGSPTGTPPAQGMDFGTAQQATQGALPNQFGAQLSGIMGVLNRQLPGNNILATQLGLTQLNNQNDLNLRSQLGLGELGIRQQQTDINRDMANAPTSVKVQFQKSMDAWKAAHPEATPAQIAIAQSNAWSEAQSGVALTGGGAPAPGSATGSRPAGPGTIGPPQRPSPVAAAGQDMARVGPEIYNLINNAKPEDLGNVMTRIYNFDQSNPGYMQTSGQDVMSQLYKVFGRDNVRGAAALGMTDPGVVRKGLRFVTGMSTPTNETARAAFRHALGLDNLLNAPGSGFLK